MSDPIAESRLALRGPLTLAHAERLHADLASLLRRGGDLVLACDPETETDLSFLQLLVAAQRSAAALGRAIRFEAPPQGPLAAALASCGFQPPPGATSLAEVLSPRPELRA